MSTSDAPTPSSRHRVRRARTRARRRKILSGVAIALAAAVFVAFATDSLRFGRDEPSVAGAARKTAQSTTTTLVTSRHACRPLSHTDPLRLWVGGDSLAGALGPSLGKIAGATGVVQPYFDSRVSSGLSTPTFFDWPKEATKEMTRLDPEVVVFIIGANDWGGPQNVTLDASGQPAWRADYEKKVEALLQILIGDRRTVYLAGSPVLRDNQQNTSILEINKVIEEVASRHDEVEYVDTYALFDDANGKFTLSQPDSTGKTVQMRAGDGVHFTTAGGDYFAQQMFQLLDTQCRITEQSVVGQALPTIQTPGSTQLGNTGSSSSSGSSGGGSVQTTTATTTPPSTAPTTTVPPPTTSTAPAAPESPTTTL